MTRHVPSRHGRLCRACHVSKRLKCAVSAGQVGKRGVNVSPAILHRIGNDLFDRAALLGIAGNPPDLTKEPL